MITCNRCGNVAPAGAVQCQRCGAALPGKVENTYSQIQGGQGQSGQPELPAWLESLRVGERPAGPAKSPSTFSASDLIEEGSLPSWMRPDQSGGNQPTPSGPPPLQRSASFPGPNTDESTSGARGFNVRSLIDEQALPAWMKEGSESGGSKSGGATEQPPASGSFSAASLVQPDALPDWMKNLQPSLASDARTPQPPATGSPGANAAPVSGMVPTPAALPVVPPVPPTPPQPSQPLRPMQPEQTVLPAQGFSAHDLIDQNALPPWMASQGGAATGATVNSGGMPEQTVLPAQGFSAHDLIDQNALPPWMASQGGAGTGATVNQGGNVNSGGTPGQTGFSASSLLDMDALPPWLRESAAQQQQQKSGSFPAANPSQQQPNMPWQGASPAQPAPTGNVPENTALNSISASSFIDMEALPEWLRSAAEEQRPNAQQGPMGMPPRSGVYGGSSRVESMRVPSRPRGEINPPEGSEVAANVFASMLGVASAAPNFPASPMPSPAPAAPIPPAQPAPSPAANIPPVSAAQPPQPGMSAVAGNIPGTPAPGGGNQQANQGYLGVYGGGSGTAYPAMQNYQNNYAIGNPPAGSPQIPATGAGQPGEQRPGTKPAKRGLFDAIRDWFFR